MGPVDALHLPQISLVAEEVGSKCAVVLAGVCFEPADAGNSQPIFGFAQYVATLALMVVVFNVSDFRYRYRLYLTYFPVHPIAFGTAFTVGALILLLDLWVHNRWLIPSWLNSHNNIRAALAAVLLLMVTYLILVAFVRPPRFGRWNAKQYFRATQSFVGKGNPDQLAIIAEELARSADQIVKKAAEFEQTNLRASIRPSYGAWAHQMLLLLGDRRMCREMVDKSPWTAARIFQSAGELQGKPPSLAQFSRNIGAELIYNERSALHHEEDGFYVGYFGYTKPITRAVYGNWKLIETLARDYGSPLDVSSDLKRRLGPAHLEAYSRASLIFSDNYFEHRSQHSLAFNRMLDTFSSAIGDVYKLKGVEHDYWKSDEFRRLQIAVEFIEELVELLDRHKVPRQSVVRPKQKTRGGIHDQIADLIFEVILAASSVSGPDWTCWEVQHNTVWSRLIDYNDGEAWKIIRPKVRRMIYDEVRRMDKYPNFKGARLLGLCLNIWGLEQRRVKHAGVKNSVALMTNVVAWTRKNYLRLVEDNPKVAAACLHGKITFDASAGRLTSTYNNDLGKHPREYHLPLDQPTASTGKL